MCDSPALVVRVGSHSVVSYPEQGARAVAVILASTGDVLRIEPGHLDQALYGVAYAITQGKGATLAIGPAEGPYARAEFGPADLRPLFRALAACRDCAAAAGYLAPQNFAEPPNPKPFRVRRRRALAA